MESIVNVKYKNRYFVEKPIHQTPTYLPLRRRRSIKSRRALNALLPREPILDVEFGADLEIAVALEENGADDDFVGAHGGLVVVGVRGAVGAVVAVYWVSCAGAVRIGLGGRGWIEGKKGRERGNTRITVVGVGFEFALCDVQGGFVGDGVQGVCAAAEQFAGVAMAGGEKFISEETSEGLG